MIYFILGNKEVLPFYFLDFSKIPSARLTFQQLEIIDYLSGDRYFETYGPGIAVDINIQPFEVFNDYKNLLRILIYDNEQKYREIHKGTPFYFMAWSAFRMKNYEDAVFYMDAAISEDERKIKGRKFKDWIKDPGGRFLTLDDQEGQVAKEITLQLRARVEIELKEFNNTSGLRKIEFSKFINHFVLAIAKNRNKRSIITALYSFILEFSDRFDMLSLRSKIGGSLEPILTHLFKGCLVVESILKTKYPRFKRGTLGDILRDTVVKKHLGVKSPTAIGKVDLSDIKKYLGEKSKYEETNFNITYGIRNTAGHNLGWTDIFDNPKIYENLYKSIIQTIFWTIYKLYLPKRELAR